MHTDQRFRDGRSVAELMDAERRLLGRNQVMPSVPEMIYDVQIEGAFPDGSKLVTVTVTVARPAASASTFRPAPPYVSSRARPRR